MPILIDARIPVAVGPAAMARADDAVLAEADLPRSGMTGAPGHPAGCACCLSRGAMAQALHRLFLARARGEVPFFRRVVVAAPDGAALAEALTGDAFVSGRYRAEG
jgi:hypothetical protein